METRSCQNCKNDFIIEQGDFDFYAKIKVPPPTFCPECRLQRRVASYNIRTLYRRNCDGCKKSVISIYSPFSKSIIYCGECYYNDNWDGTDYEVDYDFTKPFFEQFKELRLRVPQQHVRHSNNNGEGCEYANSSSKSNHVYLSFGVVGSEHIYYGYLVNKRNRMCIDCLNIKENEVGYELINSNGNFQSSFLIDSQQCIDSSFLFNCSNCQNCFMSSNLRNSSYYFRNTQLSKEEYERSMAEIDQGNFDNYQKLKGEFDLMRESTLKRYATIIKSEDSTGDMIENCNNVKDSFNVSDCQNMRYTAFLMNIASDSYDLTVSGKGERNYELVTSGGGNFDCHFCHRAQGGSNMEYSDTCKDCNYVFGCVGIRGKDYCIFNKEYTKDEYFLMREKIISHMNQMPYIDKRGRVYKFGEYFPIEISQMAYNETLAIEQFPLSKEEVLSEGYEWRDLPNKDHSTTIDHKDLPVSITEVDSSLLKETIRCAHEADCEHQCTNGFKIVDEELKLYKKLKIPLPRLCPNCRYHERLSRRLPWKLWKRVCMCKGDIEKAAQKNSVKYVNNSSHGHDGECTEEFMTPHNPDYSDIVYCKSCYQKEVL